MSAKWIKVMNPIISDFGLFKRWVKCETGRHSDSRIKVKEYNGDVYVKLRPFSMLWFMETWAKTWPDNSVVISANQLYKKEYVPKDPYGIGVYDWHDSFKDKPGDYCKDFFIKEHGGLFNNVTIAYPDEKHWVEDEDCEDGEEPIFGTMNVYDPVFVFVFSNPSDTTMFKMKYQMGKSMA